MSATDRRALLRLAAGALLLPVMAAAAPARAATGMRFAPPALPMRYTRQLERGMHDGTRMLVSRSFAIRFLPDSGGYRVEGEQVGVEVEAPPALAEFVRLERARRELGLFPLLLDPAGAIARGAGTPIATQLDVAVREALSRIATHPHDPTARAQLVGFVNAFHQSAGRLVTELPRDLFAPEDAPRSERRAIALPGGESGEVVVTFAALRDPVTGLMREARREVVTTLEDDRRRTVESWQLAPF